MSRKGKKRAQNRDRNRALSEYYDVRAQVNRLKASGDVPDAFIPKFSRNFSVKDIKKATDIGKASLSKAVKSLDGVNPESNIGKGVRYKNLVDSSYGSRRRQILDDLEELHKAQRSKNKAAIEELYRIISGEDYWVNRLGEGVSSDGPA